jgi:LL-diaminopimelate aminotransferase
MILNYPSNPTAAVAPLEFYQKAVDFAREHEIMIMQDAAYSEVYFDQPPPSILQAEEARDCCVELFSLSKTYNMTGWRLGFAVGHAEIISALAQGKGNMDSGQFNAIQEAGQVALASPDRMEVRAMLDLYRERRDALCGGLEKLGWQVDRPQATFFVWFRGPEGVDSMTAARTILEQADVVLIPGIGFGPHGEGYLRAALTVEADRLREAVGRIAKVNF